MKAFGVRWIALTACVWVGSVGCGSSDEEDSQADDTSTGDGDGSPTSGGAAAGGATGGGTGETPSGEVGAILEAHNSVRANVTPAPASPMPPLTWSSEIAQVAQSYANKCLFKHSEGTGFGENIYASTSASSAENVMASWAGEASGYNYEQNTCSGVCGHYTQVVWADSTRLGCGVANCTQNSPFGDGSWQLWVCNYDPPGNYSGQRPY